ncbi:autotransporter outer membrane beta-barrel domain-containing protein [Breoghania sp.]|uniref:autotransporter outer membrane beta-barrel domain-containing protein n=1 Tax=Breoghania sp. TaxID=2065378 RepID=UPI002AA735BB|nr:autotransporter outer membrane beta-barrel domain-containing protein [Breoghania sp.]
MSNGAGGFALNYAPSANTDEGAFSALGFADDGQTANTFADPSWSLWANVQGAWLSDSAEGSQVNGTIGLGYKLTPDFVLGGFAGYESFDYDFQEVGGTTLHSEGDGWTIGAYSGLRLSPTLRLDGMIGWTDLSYDVASSLVSGSYDASRWTAAGGLTGDYKVGTFTLNPSASLYVSWENQDGYTDDASNVHDELDFYTGRASFGGKIGKGFMLKDDLVANPYLAAYGDWRFSGEDALVANIVDTGIENGWSGRFGGGLSVISTSGINASLGAEVGGVGQETQVWSATGRVGILF